MFSPKFMNYIIDHSGDDKKHINKLPIQINEQITKEVDLLKNDTTNFINHFKLLLKGAKSKVCNKNKV